MPQHYTRFTRRSAQAMIELMLGLILILMLLVGSVQFMYVANAQNNITANLRGDVGARAMSPLLTEDTPPCIGNWQSGPDGQRFTADDVSTPGDQGRFSQIASYSVANAADWNAVGAIIQPCALELLQQPPPSLTPLGFVNSSQSVSLPVSAIAQDLFYNRPEILVKEQIWLPFVNELY